MFDDKATLSIHGLQWPFRLTLAVLLLVSLALASSTAAEELHVPLGSSAAGMSAVTEVEIVNRSNDSTIVTIEMLDPFGSVGKTTWVSLAGGEAVQWTEDGNECFGALAIKTNGRLLVAAVRRSSRGAISRVPVVDDLDATDEGTITIGPRPGDSMWKWRIAVVNPNEAPALLTVFLHRGEHVIDEASLYIPARGTRVASTDELFCGAAADFSNSLSFRAPEPLLLFGYDANLATGAQFFTQAAAPATGSSRRRPIRRPPPPQAQTVVLTPSKDNTLYQTSNGSLSNGSGVHLFAGATNRRQLRRALLAFDVASQIPPGSRITRASLVARISQTIAGPESMALHRVTADWGEGTSNAGTTRDGDGAPSKPGDATWIHTFFPDRFWSKQGGDFAAAADATAIAGDANVTWASSTAMIARVQEWLDQPSANFGWVIVGNESNAATAKRFDSREIVPTATRPALTIEFTK